MTFRIGQKVVCVARNIPQEGPNEAKGLVIGAVYTVAAISESGRGVDLVEASCRDDPSFNPIYHVPFYLAELFRPAVERKTDISIFTKMLTPNQRELAR